MSRSRRLAAIAAAFAFQLLALAQAAADAAAGATGATDPGAQPAPLLPIASFATVPVLTEPNLSPDGKAVALRMRKGAEQFLVIHELQGPAGAAGSKAISLGKATLNWVEWADSRYLVVSVRLMYHLMGDDLPFDRLVLVDRQGETSHKFLGPEREGLTGDDVIYWAPDGSYLLLNVARTTVDVSFGGAHVAFPRVIRVAIPSNELTTVQQSKPGIYRWVANSRGEIVAGTGFTAEGRRQAIYRSSPDKPFETVLRASREGDRNYVDDVYVAHIDADSQKGYLISRRGGDRWGLYEYDFATRDFGAPVFAHDKYDLANYSIDRNGKLRWTGYIDDRWHVNWIDPGAARFDEQLRKAMPDMVAQVVSTSANGDTRIIKATAPTDPGTFYLYTAASAKLQVLASVSDDLRGKTLAPMQYVAYKARDGLEIPAYLTLPVGRGTSRLPLVVMPHGGPYVRDDWSYDFLAQYLANRGYAVLQPNFRGSTGYGKAFEERGYAQWGAAMQDDVDDGVRWLVESGTADPRRVCVVGWSYGGFVAQVAAFRNPDVYRCAVSIAGISDLAAQLRYDRSFLFGDSYREWRARIRGEGLTRNLQAISSLARVDDIAMPLMLVHGTDDDRVPVSQSDTLAKALKKAGKPFDYVRIDAGDHSLDDSGQRGQLLGALEKFLALHNPTDVLQPPETAASR